MCRHLAYLQVLVSSLSQLSPGSALELAACHCATLLSSVSPLSLPTLISIVCMIPAPPTDESDSVLPVRLSVTLLGLQLETWDEGSQTLSGRHCSSLQHCSVSSCCLGIIIIMNSSSMLLFECVSIIWNEDHQMCQSNQWINECWFDGIMMAPILTVSHNPSLRIIIHHLCCQPHTGHTARHPGCLGGTVRSNFQKTKNTGAETRSVSSF